MSRVGKLPIPIPAGVQLTCTDGHVVAKGPLGQLSQDIDKEFKINISDGVMVIERPSEQKKHKAHHGLYRALINNMVVGVSKGFELKQEVVGVGYKAESNGQLLNLALGYSHEIVFEMPAEVKVVAVTERRNNPIITLTSIDKQLLGQVAAKIRSLRVPEPYKGKGIKFVGEILRKKAGKSASAK
jgi:large subunit ribosomal protein L6